MWNSFFRLTGLCVCLISGLSDLAAQAVDPYADWKAVHGVSSDAEDLDLDQIPAVLEYYCGRSPSVADSVPVVSIAADATPQVELALCHDSLVGDVQATMAQWSVGSSEWQPVALDSSHDGQRDQYEISTTGQAVGLYRFEVEAAATNGHFLSGGDVSGLAALEAHGAIYKKDGVAGDALEIMSDAGMNLFRLRIFVDPNDVNLVVNDLDYTLALAARIKSVGAHFLLDFHYSDTWADPGKQYKPAAWANLDFDELELQVESYTAEVIAAMAAQVRSAAHGPSQ